MLYLFNKGNEADVNSQMMKTIINYTDEKKTEWLSEFLNRNLRVARKACLSVSFSFYCQTNINDRINAKKEI